MKKIILSLLIISALLCGFTLFSSALGMTSGGVMVDYAFADEERNIPLLDENGWQYLTVVGYNGSSPTVEIPETVEMNTSSGALTVRYIAESAFAQNKKISKVIIPETVTEIGASAFASCTNLITVELPRSVTGVSYAMFSGCSILRDVKLPDTLTGIDDFAFENCIMLAELKIPASVTKIGHYAFMACESLVLDCSDNSYAAEYAAQNNIFIEAKDAPDYTVRIVFGVSLALGAAVIIVERLIKRALQRRRENNALTEAIKNAGK